MENMHIDVRVYKVKITKQESIFTFSGAILFFFFLSFFFRQENLAQVVSYNIYVFFLFPQLQQNIMQQVLLPILAKHLWKTCFIGWWDMNIPYTSVPYLSTFLFNVPKPNQGTELKYNAK